jgi:hypothetical protein
VLGLHIRKDSDLDAVGSAIGLDEGKMALIRRGLNARRSSGWDDEEFPELSVPDHSEEIDDRLEREGRMAAVSGILDRMDEMSRRVIRLRYLDSPECLTHDEVGRRIGRKKSRCQQLEAMAIRSIRRSLGVPEPDPGAPGFDVFVAGLWPDDDLTDEQWSAVWPLVRPPDDGLMRTVDLRGVVDAIAYKARTGCAWKQVPDRYPPVGTIRNYVTSWGRSGVLRRMVAILGCPSGSTCD